ncbi:MAG TPA: DUF4810 domain-containing protein [Candidatus Deferrimicrobiaceae bacterium]
MRGTRLNLLLFVVMSVPLAAGCGPKRAYYWGDYDSALYSHYQNPQETERYVERLGEIIRKAEVEKDKVPPGLYAEYGYALFEAGRLDDAIVYYKKERDEWQESVVFMDKMIRNTQRVKGNRTGPPPGGNLTPPAGETPGAVPNAPAPAIPGPEGGAK